MDESFTDESLDLSLRFNNDYSPLTTQGYTPLKINFSLWLQSGDPDYLDKIIMDLDKSCTEIKGVLLEQIAIAAKKRLLREYSYTKKTKVNSDILLDETCWVVFKLIHFCNKTMSDATLLAASLLDEKFPFASKKASTIDKEYAVWKKAHIDSINIVKSYKPDGWTQEEQTNFLTLFPEKISPSLKGNRRY
jgi:hypothetical protein